MENSYSKTNKKTTSAKIKIQLQGKCCVGGIHNVCTSAGLYSESVCDKQALFNEL